MILPIQCRSAIMFYSARCHDAQVSRHIERVRHDLRVQIRCGIIESMLVDHFNP